MKYLYSLLFFISFNSFAQTSFYSATLTDNDDTKKTVYFKNKQRVLNDDGTLIVYNSESSDSKVYLKAGDFKSIKTADNNLHLISVSVPNLAKTNNIILRELVAGVSSLYAYKDREGKLIYVDLTNNEFTVLARTRKDADAPVAYRQWLFENFNPKGKEERDYINFSYSSSSFIEYYIENNTNARELTQEPKVKALNLGLHAGYVSHGVTSKIGDRVYDKVTTSGYRIGTRVALNLDRIANKFTVFGGIDYNGVIDGTSPGVIFPESSTQRTEGVYTAEIPYWSFNVGAQYNIHFKSFTISPYVSFEPIFLTSDYNLNFILDDGRVFYDVNEFNKDATSFNVGVKANILNDFYILIEFSSMSQLNGVFGFIDDGGRINSEINRFSVSLGYHLF